MPDAIVFHHPRVPDAVRRAALRRRSGTYVGQRMGPGSASRHSMPQRVRDARPSCTGSRFECQTTSTLAATLRILATQIAPELCHQHVPLKTEGAGNAGCFSQHPRPRVQIEKAHEQVTTGEAVSPAFPARWFYGFLRALPGDLALLPPSSARCKGSPPT